MFALPEAVNICMFGQGGTWNGVEPSREGGRRKFGERGEPLDGGRPHRRRITRTRKAGVITSAVPVLLLKR